MYQGCPRIPVGARKREWVSDEFFSRAMREKPQSQAGWVFFLPKMEKDWTWHFPC